MTTYQNYLDNDSTVLDRISAEHLVGEQVKLLVVVDDLGIVEEMFKRKTNNAFHEVEMFVWINRGGYQRKKALIRNATVVVTNDERLVADRLLVRPTMIMEFDRSNLKVKLLKHPKIQTLPKGDCSER